MLYSRRDLHDFRAIRKFFLQRSTTLGIVSPSPHTESAGSDRLGGLDPETLIRAFRIMHLSRRLDDREITLKRQNRIFFQISGAGHEAIQVAAGAGAAAGRRLDLSLLPRSRALPGAGRHARERCCWRQSARRRTRPRAAGRCRRTGARRSSTSSAALRPPARSFCRPPDARKPAGSSASGAERITLVTSGEGATSEGEFWEAMNIACLERLPLLFLVEDNGYAISVPVEAQTAGGDVAQLLAGFPGSVSAGGGRRAISWRPTSAMQRGRALLPRRTRPGAGARARDPALSHSLSDDERLYKTAAERALEAERDPVLSFPALADREGVLDRQRSAVADARSRGGDPATRPSRRCAPRRRQPESALLHLYSPRIDPTSEAFRHAAASSKASPRPWWT